MSWTEDRVKLLRKLWLDGLSASQIAGELGMGFTRNSVTSKVHRLGLRERSTDHARSGYLKNLSLERHQRRHVAKEPHYTEVSAVVGNVVRALALTSTPELVEDQVVQISSRVTLTELGDFKCRWPLGDPTSSEFRFCGARSSPESYPYCAHHAKLAYRPLHEGEMAAPRTVNKPLTEDGGVTPSKISKEQPRAKSAKKANTPNVNQAYLREVPAYVSEIIELFELLKADENSDLVYFPKRFRKKDEGLVKEPPKDTLYEKLNSLLENEGVAVDARASLIAKFRIEIARATRPKWVGRIERGGEIATLSAPLFLKRVHAEEIAPDGTVHKEIIRAIDPELMTAVESYISRRMGRNLGLGDAEGLNFVLARPAASNARGASADSLDT
jgi:GcrA cell cycle regulator